MRVVSLKNKQVSVTFLVTFRIVVDNLQLMNLKNIDAHGGRERVVRSEKLSY